MLYFAKGSETTSLNEGEIKEALYSTYDKLGLRKKVLAIPPDLTRYHSRAGELTRYTWYYYKDKLTDILPAIGTHFPMTEKEISYMYGDTPKSLFRVHRWKDDLVTLGEEINNQLIQIQKNLTNGIKK